MGLDMHLTAEKWVQDGDCCPVFKGLTPSKIIYDVAYWRKANAIHNWFVIHCGDGEDDCRKIYVSTENLQRLLDTCKEVLANADRWGDTYPNPLPPLSGFFFGSLNMDEGYRRDLEDTIDVCVKALKTPKLSYYYQASW